MSKTDDLRKLREEQAKAREAGLDRAPRPPPPRPSDASSEPGGGPVPVEAPKSDGRARSEGRRGKGWPKGRKVGGRK